MHAVFNNGPDFWRFGGVSTSVSDDKDLLRLHEAIGSVIIDIISLQCGGVYKEI